MKTKEQLRIKRHNRLKKKMFGTAEKPRLVVRRSLKNFSAQLVDDAQGKIIFSLSTFDKALKDTFPAAGNVKSTGQFGEIFAQRAKVNGVSKIIFDRAGYLYHGRIKTFAEALRKGGLEF